VNTVVGEQVQLHVANSRFHLNTAFERELTLTARGGAVFIGIANTSWSGVNFTNNTAQGKFDSCGGAIAFHATSTNVLTDCYFMGNMGFKGGALALTSTGVRLWGKSIRVLSNTAADAQNLDAARLSSYGGGLWAANGVQVWLNKTVFESNKAKYGGGLAIEDRSQLVLHQSQVEENIATAGGAGLNIESEANVTLFHCSVNMNTAHFGGALNVKEGSLQSFHTSFSRNQGTESAGVLYVRSTQNVSFSECRFTENRAHSVVGGGVMYSDSPSLTSFVKSNFTANQAVKGEGGVLLLNMKAVARFESCEFTQNSAYMAGGAISVHEAVMNVSYSDFSYNRVVYAAGGGGAVSITDGSQPYFANCDFQHHAGDWGSVMKIAASKAVLVSCAIQNNTSSRGSLHIAQQSHVTLTNTRFENNKAATIPPAHTSNGAAIQITDGVVTLRSSHFGGNQALQGVGGSIWVGVRGILNGSNCTFDANKAMSGGAIATSGKIMSRITSTTFNNNTALTGGAIQVGSKALLTILNSTLDSNHATIDQGGALVAAREARIVLRGVSFFRNTAATFGGGACFSIGCHVNIWGSMSFENNVAGDAGGALFFLSRRGLKKSTRWSLKNNRAGTYGDDIATDVNSAIWSSSQDHFRDGVTSSHPFQVTLIDGYNSPVTSPKLGDGIECRLASTAEIIAGGRIEFTSRGIASWETAKLQGDTGSFYEASFTCQWQRCVDAVVTVSNATVVKTVRNTACRRGEFTDHFKSTRWCRMCPKGKYAISVVDRCSPCPSDAVCEGGDHMRPRQGAWEASRNRSKVYSCPFPATCLGGEDSACGVGHTGAVCGECLPGYTRSEGGCVACSSDGGIALALPGFTLLILAILGCLGYKYINIDPDAEEEDVGTVGFMGVGLEMEMKATKQAHMEQDQHKGQDAKEIEDLIRDLGGIIRILVGHLQMLAIFHASMPHVAWPPLIRYLSQMAVVLNLNLIHLVPVGCLMDGMDSFYGTFSLTVAIPAAVWMILACKAGIEQGSLCRRHDGQKQITDRQVKTFIWIIYLMYPFICSTVLQLFNCREIEGTWFISADVSLVCYDDTYFLYAYVGLAAFAMYVVGIPFVLYLILKHNEDKLWSDSHTMERYGVLYLPYKEDRWSAELVEMVRKLMLVVLSSSSCPNLVFKLASRRFCRLRSLFCTSKNSRFNPERSTKHTRLPSWPSCSLLVAPWYSWAWAA